jgi:hypothetical protein
MAIDDYKKIIEDQRSDYEEKLKNSEIYRQFFLKKIKNIESNFDLFRIREIIGQVDFSNFVNDE